MKKLLAVTVALLALPAVAIATPSPPIGQVICETECFTVEATDTIVLAASNDPTFVWDIRRYHEYRKRTPYVWMVYAQSGDETDTEILTNDPSKNTPDCNPTGENHLWMEPYPGLKGTGYISREGAPQGFIDACKLLTAEQAAVVVAAQRGDETVAAAPVAAATCAPIAYNRKKVAVTSRGATCLSGRNIMARWLRRGIEPTGYVCVTARIGRVRAATCAKPAGLSRATQPRITGRWRV